MTRAHADAADTKTFQLGRKTKLHLQTGDITKWSGDAIVNAGTRKAKKSCIAYLSFVLICSCGEYET